MYIYVCAQNMHTNNDTYLPYMQCMNTHVQQMTNINQCAKYVTLHHIALHKCAHAT